MTSYGKLAGLAPLSPDSCHTRICQHYSDRTGCINQSIGFEPPALPPYSSESERTMFAQRIFESIDIEPGLVVGSPTFVVICLAVREGNAPMVVFTNSMSLESLSKAMDSKALLASHVGDSPEYYWIEKTREDFHRINGRGVASYTPAEWIYKSIEEVFDYVDLDALNDAWLTKSDDYGPVFCMPALDFRRIYMDQNDNAEAA